MPVDHLPPRTQFLGDGKVKPRVTLTARESRWRAGVVTICVLIVTAASSSIGSYFSGIFAFFPVAMASFFIILHLRVGGPAAASVAAHAQAPLVGMFISLYAVHHLAEHDRRLVGLRRWAGHRHSVERRAVAMAAATCAAHAAGVTLFLFGLAQLRLQRIDRFHRFARRHLVGIECGNGGDDQLRRRRAAGRVP